MIATAVSHLRPPNRLAFVSKCRVKTRMPIEAPAVMLYVEPRQLPSRKCVFSKPSQSGTVCEARFWFVCFRVDS